MEYLVYIIIPISAAIIGWFTNVLALKMTFYPIELRGIAFPSILPLNLGVKRIVIGWQGIIPSKAAFMADKSVDMMTKKLLNVQEQFSLIKPERVAEEMEPTILALSRDIMGEAMSSQVPLLWKTIPNSRKESVYKGVAKELPHTIEEIMEDVKDNIMELWDLKGMVKESLTRDKELLNKIFLECGKREFKIIEWSGLYFGFWFGVVQMVIWFFIQDLPYAWISLPVGGLIIGYITNVLALKFIFEPAEPINLGFYKVQGLFIKRQQEVSAEYARIVTEHILTMPNIFHTIIEGQASDKLMRITERHVYEAVDKAAGMNRSLIQLTSGTKAYENIKKITVKRFMEELPDYIHEIFDYAEETLHIETTLREKMGELPPQDFVQLLRPIFEEDEYKLILVGAFLGMLAGILQLLTFML